MGACKTALLSSVVSDEGNIHGVAYEASDDEASFFSERPSSKIIHEEDYDEDDERLFCFERDENGVFDRIVESGIFQGGSICSIEKVDVSTAGKCAKKKKNKKKTTASTSVEELRAQIEQTELNTDVICDEFLNLMSTGLNILAASNLGGSRSITLKIDRGNVCWGVPKAKSSVSYSLSDLSNVENGLPSKILKLYSSDDNTRALTMQFEGSGFKKQVAAFLAPSPLERDALVRGFCALIEMNRSVSKLS